MNRFCLFTFYLQIGAPNARCHNSASHRACSDHSRCCCACCIHPASLRLATSHSIISHSTPTHPSQYHTAHIRSVFWPQAHMRLLRSLAPLLLLLRLLRLLCLSLRLCFHGSSLSIVLSPCLNLNPKCLHWEHHCPTSDTPPSIRLIENN